MNSLQCVIARFICVTHSVIFVDLVAELEHILRNEYTLVCLEEHSKLLFLSSIIRSSVGDSEVPFVICAKGAGNWNIVDNEHHLVITLIIRCT